MYSVTSSPFCQKNDDLESYKSRMKKQLSQCQRANLVTLVVGSILGMAGLVTLVLGFKFLPTLISDKTTVAFISIVGGAALGVTGILLVATSKGYKETIELMKYWYQNDIRFLQQKSGSCNNTLMTPCEASAPSYQTTFCEPSAPEYDGGAESDEAEDGSLGFAADGGAVVFGDGGAEFVEIAEAQ